MLFTRIGYTFTRPQASSKMKPLKAQWCSGIFHHPVILVSPHSTNPVCTSPPPRLHPPEWAPGVPRHPVHGVQAPHPPASQAAGRSGCSSKAGPAAGQGLRDDGQRGEGGHRRRTAPRVEKVSRNVSRGEMVVSASRKSRWMEIWR